MLGKEKHLWSRGEELITDKFPELHCLARYLPNGTVVDGELLPYKDGEIGNFNALQKRIGRKTVSQKLQNEVPIVIMLYDLLEWEGKDIRTHTLAQRQELLADLSKKIKGDGLPLLLSKVMGFSSWEKVAQERAQIKSETYAWRKDSPMIGRKKVPGGNGNQIKTIDDLDICHGTRKKDQSIYRLYLALWRDKELVTFAKAYSGLPDAEIKKVDQLSRTSFWSCASSKT